MMFNLKNPSTFMKKVDSICESINPILAVIAVGLGMLCATIFYSNMVMKMVNTPTTLQQLKNQSVSATGF